MPSYTILSPIRVGGRTQKTGRIELSERRAAPLIESGSLRAAEQEPPADKNPPAASAAGKEAS